MLDARHFLIRYAAAAAVAAPRFSDAFAADAIDASRHAMIYSARRAAATTEICDDMWQRGYALLRA